MPKISYIDHAQRSDIMNLSAEELHGAYEELYPSEKCVPNQRADCIRIFNNWLERCKSRPEEAIATANWYGKCTKALFHVLKIKIPKTKAQMIEILKKKD